ncbi:trigger factor [Psychroflexus sp. CAK57W]|uniref:trigger factor n=1 Tax=Psychroflexus curvus TaxID=2873595 RepID=UPI001CCD1B39|nr:trigger factor [Psychroflexus curvus]MBZ9628690.1 trigger factor [Psychroflexus curvus]MBZ9786769.1 trigger factor [Psychroflexus curvus]
MNITREDKDQLNSVVKINIEKNDYSPKVEKILKDYRRTANIPGFRKGMVPMGMIKKQYGQAVLVDEVNKLLQDSLNSYITEEKIDILGNPLPMPQDDLNWESDEYTFEFELGLAPKFDVTLEGEGPVTYYNISADEEMIDNQIKTIQRQYGKLVTQEEVKDGFTVVGTFHNEEEGIENEATFKVDDIDGKTNKKELLGAKVGDQVILKSNKLFKDDDTLARHLGLEKEKAENLKVELTFTIKEINEQILAELNQELFDKAFGEGEVTSEKEAKEKIAEQSKETFKQQGDQQFFNDVTEHLIEKADMELPSEFLQKWLQTQGEKQLTTEEAKEEYEKSEKGIKYQLIEAQIAKNNDIKIEVEDIKKVAKEKIKMQMQQFGQMDFPEDQMDGIIQNLMSNEEQVKQFSEEVMVQKLLQLYKDKMEVEEKDITYKEFVDKIYK